MRFATRAVWEHPLERWLGGGVLLGNGGGSQLPPAFPHGPAFHGTSSAPGNLSRCCSSAVLKTSPARRWGWICSPRRCRCPAAAPSTGAVLHVALVAGLSPVGLALQEQQEPRLHLEHWGLGSSSVGHNVRKVRARQQGAQSFPELLLAHRAAGWQGHGQCKPFTDSKMPMCLLPRAARWWEDGWRSIRSPC